GHQRGRTTTERLKRNFGMPNPEGYRKALRLFHLAEKFGLPLITFIDTQGAFPGLEAEERGQAEAIARALQNAGATRSTRAIAIGHMPDLALLAAYYLCGNEGALDFERAALATFAFPNLPTAELGRLISWTTPTIHSLCAPINDE
ncbi:MAG: hypothetical protein EBS30_08535, partial [Planctomycetes bacterium]|nr:hypothetical protein [Planctomycetota bacterium]